MRRFRGMALSLVGLVAAVGCSGGNSDYKKTAELKKAPALHEDHDHGEKGPHGGSLVELGKEEYHAEVVVDHDAHVLRVFVLGKDAKTPVATSTPEVTLAIKGKDPLKLKAAPQEGDGEGKASRFELKDHAVIHDILDAGAIHADLTLTIDDKPFTGDVDYHLHGVHHDHKDDAPADKAKEGAETKEPAKPEGDATDKPEAAKPDDK